MAFCLLLLNHYKQYGIIPPWLLEQPANNTVHLEFWIVRKAFANLDVMFDSQ